MMRLKTTIARIPRVALFALAALIQVAVIAMMVVDRMQILRDGAEVTLQTQPVDPRDFLRGDYVVLNYEIATLQAGALTGQATTRGAPIYVKLSPSPQEFHAPVSVHPQPVPVAGNEVLLQARLLSGSHCGTSVPAFCEKILVTYGIERYFVPEGEGLAIEQRRDKRKVSVVAAVTPGGRAAIKRLVIDGKPVYEEPLF